MDKEIDRALARFKLCVDAEQKQRKREAEDLQFQVPELQWPKEVKDMRGQQVMPDGSIVAPRAMLSIPKLGQPIQLVNNKFRAAHLGVKIEPLSEEATDKTAEVIQGIYRQIERDSRANLARGWAYDRATKAGSGVYRIDKVYDPEGGHWTDQKLVFKRILYQASVYTDPFCEEPDKSDKRFEFVTHDMPVDRYKEKHPKTKLAKMDSEELTAIGDTSPGWITGEGPGCTVRVAEYWRVEITTKTRVLLDDGTDSYEGDIPTGRTVIASREIEERKVLWSVINAIEEVEETVEWDGQYIPLIQVVGRELQPFDGERRSVGIIHDAKDGQRMFNYAASNAVDLAALEPRAPFDVDPEEIEGYEEWYQQAAIRNFPYLPRHKFLHGQVMPPLSRIQADASKLGPSMMLLQQADSFIQAATTTLDQSKIEAMGKRRVAHQTISALQEQSDFGTSDFLDNFVTISIPYEAKVVLDLIPHVYDRPGRIARILDDEDNQQTVMLNQPFVTDPNTKRPMPVQTPQPQQAAADDRNPVKHFDLTKGRYSVSVSVGKSYQSRVDEGAEEIGDILSTDPQLMPLIGPIYFKYRNFPGHDEIAELLKKVRSKQFPGLDDEEQTEGAKAQQQLQQAQQLIQQMQDQMKGMQQALETDQAKQQADIEKAKIGADKDIRLQMMRDATSIAVAKINAAAKGVQIEAQAEDEAIALAQEHAHQAMQSERDRQHERDMAQLTHQQGLEAADVGTVQQAVLAEQAAGHTQQATAQEAALVPPNPNGGGE